MKHTISPDKFDGIISLIEERFKDVFEKLERIEGQTTRTNGRVTVLENWKNVSVGAIGVVSAVVVPVLLYLVYIHIG
jgi:hypothetical protein